MKKIKLNNSEFGNIATTVLQTGRSFCFQAHGSSMAPFVRGGDVVFIRQSPQYRIGDIVLLENSYGFLLHRIIKKSETSFITRGDALTAEDTGTISSADILGKVYRVSGDGYNFHLRFPFNRLIAKRFFSNIIFQNHFSKKIGKRLASYLG